MRARASQGIAGRPAQHRPASDAAAPASFADLRVRARRCRACPLYRNATQTVFGEGPTDARMMLVGEQPGDREDLAGRPFVGPAGQLLDRALREAGVDRGQVYVTNAVKHFKWKPEGKRRLHQKPGAREIEACRPWFEAERSLIRPAVIVALGATAAQALMGRSFRITASRGKVLPGPGAGALVATFHPSAVLRTPPEDREEMFGHLVADLKVALRAAAHRPAGRRDGEKSGPEGR